MYKEKLKAVGGLQKGEGGENPLTFENPTPNMTNWLFCPPVINGGKIPRRSMTKSHIFGRSIFTSLASSEPRRCEKRVLTFHGGQFVLGLVPK